MMDETIIKKLAVKTQNTLLDAVKDLQHNPGEIAQTLAFAANFPAQMFNNTVLLRKQLPEAQHTESYAHWKELGYTVKRGEKGLHIFLPQIQQVFVTRNADGVDVIRPVSEATDAEKANIKAGTIQTKTRTSYVTGTVFDVSQTTCPVDAYPAPYPLNRPLEQLYAGLLDYAAGIGCTVDIDEQLTQADKMAALAGAVGKAVVEAAIEPEHKPSVSVRDFEADAVSLMLETQMGLQLTDQRITQFTQYFNDCQTSRFNLNDTLRTVSEIYTSLRTQLDPVLDRTLQELGQTEQVVQSTAEEKQQATQKQKLAEERRLALEQEDIQKQKEVKEEYREEAVVAVEAAAATVAAAAIAGAEAVQRQRVFVDMDGTLCQFQPNATPHQLQTRGYFSSLAPQRNVVDAVKALVADSTKEVFILSAALNTPTAIPEKNQWIDTYLPEIDSTHRLFPQNGVDKATAVPGGVQPSDVLIDDYTRNLRAWPGFGIKLVNAINNQHGTWIASTEGTQGSAIRYDRPAQGLVDDINALISTRDALPEMFLNERQAYLKNVLSTPRETVQIDTLSSLSARSAQDTLLRGRGMYPCSVLNGKVNYFPFNNEKQYATLMTPRELATFDHLLHSAEPAALHIQDAMPETVTVTSQAGLDAVPLDTAQQIVAAFGDAGNPAEIRNAYTYPVIVADNHSANVYGDAHVEARNTARIHAFGDSVVHAFGAASVEANEHSTVMAHNSSSVHADQSSLVHAFDQAAVQAFETANVILHDASSAILRGTSTGTAYDNSKLQAMDSSRALRAGNSRVAIRGNAEVQQLHTQQTANVPQWIARSQPELDAVPAEYPGAVVVDFGAADNPAKVAVNHIMPVTVIGNHAANIYQDVHAIARDTAQVTAQDNSIVHALNLSQVTALDNSHVIAMDGSSVFLHDSSTAEQAADTSIVLNQRGQPAEHENGVMKVSTQAELNAVPADYEGRVIVNFGTEEAPAQIAQKYVQPVLVPNRFVATARNDSNVQAGENASIYAFDNSHVVGYGSSYIEISDSCRAELYEQSVCNAFGTSAVSAHDTASIAAVDESTVEAHGSSNVDARNNAVVDAYDTAQISANNTATVRTHSPDVVTKMHGSSVLAPAETESAPVPVEAEISEPIQQTAPEPEQSTPVAEKEPVKEKQKAPVQAKKKTFAERRAEWDQQKRDERDYIKNRVNILDVAEDLGYTITRQGLHDSLQEHDSVVFYPNNHFARFSRTGLDGKIIGGSTVDFVMHFDQDDGLGLGIHDASDAIRYLKQQYMGIGPEQQYKPRQQKPRQPEKKPFVLPEKSANMERAVQYLHDYRGISSTVIEQCADRGLLYQNKGMAVFVGMDKDGKAVYATRQGTDKPVPGQRSFKCDVAGSDQHVGWYVDNKSDKLYVTEAPIDAMSVMTLREQGGHDVNSSNYLALNGTGKAYILYERLQADPSIKSVVLALDNDKAGLEADQKIQDYLKENLPNVSVSAWKVPQGKDVNEYLQVKNSPQHTKPQQHSVSRTAPQPESPQLAV